MLKIAFGEEAMCRTQTYEWWKHFKEGRTSVVCMYVRMYPAVCTKYNGDGMAHLKLILLVTLSLCFLPLFGAIAPIGARSAPYRGFEITLKHTTLGRTPLDKWSAQRRDFYLTTHNTHKRNTTMLPAGFEPLIVASERPQIQNLDGAVTGTSHLYVMSIRICSNYEQEHKITLREGSGRFS
jgi:hypothetical protein